jgi:hypothetical protein
MLEDFGLFLVLADNVRRPLPVQVNFADIVLVSICISCRSLGTILTTGCAHFAHANTTKAQQHKEFSIHYCWVSWWANTGHLYEEERRQAVFPSIASLLSKQS